MKDEAAPRRFRILRTAERLFIHYGPSKTTVADIARACGIGVGSVYLDFANKEEIVQELANEKARIVATRMKSAASRAGEDAAEQLVAALRARVVALLDFTKDGQHACDLVRCADGTAKSSGGGFALGEEPRRVLRELLVAGVARGELASEDPEATLGTIELAFGCLSPPLLYRFERKAAEDKAARLATLIVFGVSSRAGRPPRG